jgi:hypothetical protein
MPSVVEPVKTEVLILNRVPWLKDFIKVVDRR